MAKIGKVAYKLELPASTLIHPVFHVSQLKKHIGNHITQGTPPMIPKTATLQPRTVLDRRMVKLHNQAHTQVLILWEGLASTEATWENLEEIQRRFPLFNLEDKLGFQGGQLLQAEEEERE